MLKLLLCLLAALVVGLGLLQLRQQRLELGYEANRLHRDLQVAQLKLWRQQVQIAADTAPTTRPLVAVR